jgi:hypothetical protein
MPPPAFYHLSLSLSLRPCSIKDDDDEEEEEEEEGVMMMMRHAPRDRWASYNLHTVQ